MTTHRPTEPLATLPVAAGAGTLALAAMVVGQFVETPYEARSSGWSIAFAEGGGPGALALVVAFAAVGAAVVGAVVHRGSAAPGRTGRRALGLAIAGVVTIPVFWTGLPAALGTGAALLAVAGRQGEPAWTLPGRVALGLGVALLAAAAYLAVAG